MGRSGDGKRNSLLGWPYAWKAAGDELTVSKYCKDKDTAKRCMEDSNGCGCTQNFPQACDAQSSSCCQSEAQKTCCKGEIRMKLQ